MIKTYCTNTSKYFIRVNGELAWQLTIGLLILMWLCLFATILKLDDSLFYKQLPTIQLSRYIVHILLWIN